MYYFLTASKDTTIFSQQAVQNTGLDEILEVSKVYYGNLKDTARSLVKFDLNTLPSKLSSGAVTMSEAQIVIRETQPSEIALAYSLHIHPISQSWEMGIGTRFDNISTDGCTWNYRASGSKWLPTEVPNGGLATGSYDGRGGSNAADGMNIYVNAVIEGYYHWQNMELVSFFDDNSFNEILIYSNDDLNDNISQSSLTPPSDEIQKNDDIYLSYSEKKILDGIKNNEKLLKENNKLLKDQDKLLKEILEKLNNLTNTGESK